VRAFSSGRDHFWSRNTTRRMALILLMALLGFLAAASFDGPYASASPTVTILNPAPSETVSGTVHIKVQCTDPAGIKGIEVTAGDNFQGDKWFSTPYPTSYTWEADWDTTQENNGLAHIDSTCYNALSEAGGSGIIVTVNNVKGPSVSWQTPSSSQQFLSTVTTCQAKASVSKGEGSNINRIRFWADSTLLETKTYSPTVSSTTYTRNVDLTALSVGSAHVLKLEARNTDGGVTTSTRTIYRINQYMSVYLAEGSTAWMDNCSEYISIENPNTTSITAQLTYMVEGSGSVPGPTVSMPPNSQATINPYETVGRAHFSTKVECLEGKTISADRTMIWNNGPGEEGHCAVGVTSPATTWYLPEGSSNWGFETWTLIQNPNAEQANVTLTYMTDSGEAIPVNHQVPAGSRASFNMAGDIGSRDASTMVTSNVPVIPERAMYRDNRREGHDSVGTTTPATDYYLAEGTTGWGFTTYVLIQNPHDSATEVTATYMTPLGTVAESFTMSPNSRKTINVNAIHPDLPHPDFSTRVHGSQTIIAERAMYWNNGTGEACHDSIGMASAHTSFYLPDGDTSNGRETWTLVQNPNSSPVTVDISYLTPTGEGNVTRTETLGANSRQSFNMIDHSGISGRAAIKVTSKTTGKKIMVERAMYWNSRGAGTDTIGGFSD
jgi:hypothetical protein